MFCVGIVRCVVVWGIKELVCICVVGRRRVIMRIYIFLVAGGVLCMTMYEAIFPSKVVGFLSCRRKTIQPIRGRVHL